MSESKLQRFWNKRFQDNGHNGFNDPFLYSIDQHNRLKKIENIIKNLQSTDDGVAIDFGCGDGDFTKLLIDYGYKVYGIEISDRALSHCLNRFPKNFEAISTSEFLEMSEGLGASIIISITTLQHLVVDEEYEQMLDAFNRHTNRNANLIILEKIRGHPVQKKGMFITVVRSADRIISDLTRRKFTLEKCSNYDETFHIILRAALKLKSLFRPSNPSARQLDVPHLNGNNVKTSRAGLLKRLLYVTSVILSIIKPIHSLFTSMHEHRIFIFRKR